ncbi:GntR family transcriptional regulator [Mycolicibacterium sp. CBMA 234]|uniref:GntR family transcriptional regulator n=1 Tax=Mycolicibacterium sp. CBMA 234 TaxID=1918495 RepID=UPI00281642B3|nr:GntR family transcriptional regulator [Mycolicibacterium sp. CBMA 234]
MAIEQTPASERAYRDTKTKILVGAVKGGQLLSEVEVAAELGVSRTPVHEAFLRLAAEDLLDLLPRRGAVVVPIPPHEATDLLEMRLALEGSAVRRLCRSETAARAASAELAELIDQQRGAAADLARFAELDNAFHRHIVDAAGNCIAQRFYSSLGDRQRRMMADAVHADRTLVERLIAEHVELAHAVGARDATAFDAQLLSHLESTYEVVLR